MSSRQFHYADEKLKEACRGLAIGEGDVRSRLVTVYTTLARLRPEDDLPAELSVRLIKILAALTTDPPLLGADGRVLKTAVEQSMRRKVNRTASRIARQIVDLKADLDRYRLEQVLSE